MNDPAPASGAEAAGAYVRLCPTCGQSSPSDVLRCACGALLFGVDLRRADLPPAPEMQPAAPAAPASAPTAGPRCAHEDCGQPNPPGSDTCLYCNRPLDSSDSAAPAEAAARPVSPRLGLVRLPQGLADRYRVLRPLPARGAEADILVAEPRAGGAPVAVKIWRTGVHPKPGVAERLARVDPRHRVAVLESGRADGHDYEVQEFCAAGSLRELFASGVPGEALMTHVVSELAAALAAVHAAGLVHRDLKPDNVLLRGGAPPDLVLTDFGIASVVDATQHFTGAARTLHYAAPETLSGVIDAKADWWALGMLLLEGALGRHPFAGLSEAVILHHLATRSVDAGGVASPRLRQLLRGLLLRDPARRWGAAEVGRWLAGDPALAEPREAQAGEGFAQPYHLGEMRCTTREQLAIALTRHWAAGVADLGNRQLLAWFRDVQRDQNTVRLLLDMQADRALHPDRQLLRLVLHLASGLPPVWRGDSVEPAAVLERARMALRGDAAAARWLAELHDSRALEDYAAAGHPDIADLVRRWSAAVDAFQHTWADTAARLREHQRSLADPAEVVRYDDVVYGQQGPRRPSPGTLHPRLLALAYDPAWGEHLRARLGAELAALQADCPWLAALGDPRTMDPPTLLATEALLPEARRVGQLQAGAQKRVAQADSSSLGELRARWATAMEGIASAAGRAGGLGGDPGGLRAALPEAFDMLDGIRGSGRADADWQNLRRLVLRAEPVLLRLRDGADGLAVRLAANRGWISWRSVATGVGVVVMSPAPVNVLLALAGGAVLLWRWLPVALQRAELRSLAQRLRRSA